MNDSSRRSFLITGLAAGAGWALSRRAWAKPRQAKATIGLGFSLYGMRSLKTGAAISACAEIGYDCVELPVMKDWPADTARFSNKQATELRRQLSDAKLRLSALMENLRADVDDAQHRQNLDRLRAAGELGHALSPDRPPVIETVLGGRPADWEESRERIAARLVDWARVGEQTKTVIAIKAHVGGAMHLPEHPVWIAQRVDSRRLRCAYDYSHFELRGVDMADSIRTLVPESVFIHVKDSRGEPGKVQFLLPGDGAIDYPKYLKLVTAAGYQGDIVVEVSGQLHRRLDYDPLEAARKSYANLAAAFRQAGIERAS